MPYWAFVKIAGDYNVWYSKKDQVYQVTKTKAPPVHTAGYHNLESLLKLKGVKK